MNKKLKICLLAAPILAASTASIGATTYAWISARTYQNVTHSNITIESDTTTMAVSFYRLSPDEPSTSNGLDDGPLTSAMVTDSGKYVVNDVSSKYGDEFYRPNGVNTFKQVSANEGNYLQYGIQIAMSHTQTARKLKILCTWFSNETPDVISDWIRVGIIQCDDANFTAKTGGKKLALMRYVDYPYNQYVSGTSINDLHTYNSDELISNANPTTLLETDGRAMTTYWKLTIWLEGTCSDDQEIARDKTLSLTSRFTLDK